MATVTEFEEKYDGGEEGYGSGDNVSNWRGRVNGNPGHTEF